MRLLPESRRVLDLLEAGASDLAEHLTVRAVLIAELVPSCILVCLRLEPTGLTVALADPAVDLATLAPRRPRGSADVGASDVLSERLWQRERAADVDARCAASIALGFHSQDQITGQLCAYATRPEAFADHANVLSALVGAPAQKAVMNHDLPMRALDDAREAPDRLADFGTVECAVGFLMARDGLDADAARGQLSAAAERAGMDVVDFARALVHRR
jgi:hypothetical protein